ncbi:hypothetical protein BC941DRAFT_503914 [Chlamydoabsidia padenii]|nr:hypothetical protein BC941DRAFT_503914 [Chlamydoabsidia padenii]
MSNENLTQEELDSLKQAFALYDYDEDGKLDFDEFKTIIQSLDSNLTEESATILAQKIDKTNDGMIDFEGFVCGMIQLSPFNNDSEQTELRKWNTCSSKHDEDDLMDCFRAFDTNHDGFISRAELEKVMQKLGEDLTSQDIQDMMAEADTNKDGHIDFDEFKSLLS